MNRPKAATEHLLLFRGGDWDKGLSPEELHAAMNAFTRWYERLEQQGRLKGAQPLEHEGRIVSKSGVSDGPFVESKEAVGGYFLLDVSDFDQAVAIARECPVLKYGCTIEVRPVAEECPTFRRINQQIALA